MKSDDPVGVPVVHPSQDDRRRPLGARGQGRHRGAQTDRGVKSPEDLARGADWLSWMGMSAAAAGATMDSEGEQDEEDDQCDGDAEARPRPPGKETAARRLPAVGCSVCPRTGRGPRHLEPEGPGVGIEETPGEYIPGKRVEATVLEKLEECRGIRVVWESSSREIRRASCSFRRKAPTRAREDRGLRWSTRVGKRLRGGVRRPWTSLGEGGLPGSGVCEVMGHPAGPGEP